MDTAQSSNPQTEVVRRVLLAHGDVPTNSLVRDTLENFTWSEVDMAPNADIAFERALQRPYALFIFAFDLPTLDGEVLYEFISKAYRYREAGLKVAPPIIYLGEASDTSRSDSLRRDARVRGVLLRPLSLDRLIQQSRTVLLAREPG